MTKVKSTPDRSRRSSSVSRPFPQGGHRRNRSVPAASTYVASSPVFPSSAASILTAAQQQPTNNPALSQALTEQPEREYVFNMKLQPHLQNLKELRESFDSKLQQTNIADTESLFQERKIVDEEMARLREDNERLRTVHGRRPRGFLEKQIRRFEEKVKALSLDLTDAEQTAAEAAVRAMTAEREAAEARVEASEEQDRVESIMRYLGSLSSKYDVAKANVKDFVRQTALAWRKRADAREENADLRGENENLRARVKVLEDETRARKVEEKVAEATAKRASKKRKDPDVSMDSAQKGKKQRRESGL
ncbi:hypothetical protein LTR56_001406 [Elasticomyces elasticus]|nr:hypothetical protein LTR56_001406 [Elasticomyces elasticus]KAK3668671.1 hypothetical protein LTR22_000558 [Elasticomyces elasticus]KAK4932023.1 hypothetical protein LTR49_001710 [Elasticomyces elasticus]KAK5768446.1 hypothetical protein LTS12_001234 [Elasticomyces elasticus]